MSKKSALSKSDIFAKKGMEPKTVHVPEWGGDVRYKPMSMSERREVRKKSTDMKSGKDGDMTVNVDTEKLEIYAVITCTLEPDSDKLMFGPEDVVVLEEQMTAGGISTVAQAVLRDSGMTGGAAFSGEEEA